MPRNLEPLGKVVTELQSLDWLVKRHGHVVEVEGDDGRIQYVVEVWDEDREPFLRQRFNDPVPASRFLERLQEQGFRNKDA